MNTWNFFNAHMKNVVFLRGLFIFLLLDYELLLAYVLITKFPLSFSNAKNLFIGVFFSSY